MNNNWTIPNFPGLKGDLQTFSKEMRDKYQALLDMFTPAPDDGKYPHTNLEPGVRLSKEDPFLKPSNLNRAGMREIEIAVVPQEIWEQKYASEASIYAPKIPHVDKTKSVANQKDYYSALAGTGGPCNINQCTVLSTNGTTIQWWNPGSALANLYHPGTTTIFDLPFFTMDIASYWVSGKLRFWVQEDDNVSPFHLHEYDIDPANCEVTFIRQIECPVPIGSPLNWIDDGAGGCSINPLTQLWGMASGGTGDAEVHEYDISGPVAVLTTAWTAYNHLIPGNNFTDLPAGLSVQRSTIVGDMIYIPNVDMVVVNEQWRMSDGIVYPARVVLRDRANGYAYVDSCLGPNYNYALWCQNGSIYSTGKVNGINGSYEVYWGTNPMSINMTADYTFTASGASVSPPCCAGTGIPPIPSWVGYSCNQTTSGCPYPCVDASANCGGNNADGSIQWEIDEVTSVGGTGANAHYEWSVTNGAGVVVNAGIYDGPTNTITITVGTSQTSSANPIPNNFTYVCWTSDGLLPGNYTCAITNFSGGGNTYPNMNINGTVLGDTPLACPGDPICCAPSWNCSGDPTWICSDPGDGTGIYNSLANCQANCAPIPPDPPTDPPQPGGSHCLIKNCDEH